MSNYTPDNYLSPNDFDSVRTNYIWRIVKLTDTAKLPNMANNGDAGYDFYSDEDAKVAPGETRLISTGLSMAIPKGYYLDLRPRSGMSLNYPNYIANAPGTIDATYRGEVKVIVTNTSGDYLNIVKGFKICQGVIKKYHTFPIEAVDSLEDTDRIGGFGSTGYYAKRDEEN